MTNDNKRRPRLLLHDSGADIKLESLAIYTLDANGKVLSTTPISDKGYFDLTSDALSNTSRVAVARAAEGKQPPDLTNAVLFQSYDIAERLRAGDALELGANDISILHPPFRCAEGSVRHCYPYPLVVKSLAAEIQQQSITTASSMLEPAARESASGAFREFLPFPRCRPVCDGVVEIYRRTCCCTPIIYRDPRIDLLKDRLREIVAMVPKIHWPIPPDPGPIEEAILAHGTLDQLKSNARADFQALTVLEPAEQVLYINARPYLFHVCCHCGPAQKVGQGYLRPDGTFRICFIDVRQRFFCWSNYAFIVKQSINGSTVTIYNGVATHNWFNDISDVDLVTYNPHTINCRQPDPPVNPNAVYLQDVGLTPAWRLGKPANGINPAAPYAPVFTDGLINPNGLGAAGAPWNRNLGGTLRLAYYISESLRGTAKYYRLSWVPATNLNATPTVLPAMTWNYTQIVGTSVHIIPQPLGVPGTDLSEIPYEADHPWQSFQYHGEFDTTGRAPAWYVVILELFDAARNPITSGINFVNWNRDPATDTPATPVTDPVPYGKLLEPLYVDNRPCYGDIHNVTAPASTGSDADCLYLVGGASQQVRFEYNAGFPDPNFLWQYSFWVHRGLSGANRYLISGRTTNSLLPWDHVDSDIGTLLEGHQRCALAANLDVIAKTTDGIYNLTANAPDQIAFSLEQSPWP